MELSKWLEFTIKEAEFCKKQCESDNDSSATQFWRGYITSLKDVVLEKSLCAK